MKKQDILDAIRELRQKNPKARTPLEFEDWPGWQHLSLTKESGRFLSWKNIGLGRKMAFQLVKEGELYA